jgi:hypothetical protein
VSSSGFERALNTPSPATSAAPLPRVLFISNPAEDYLADGLFLGLRALLGPSAIDYPRMDALYETVTPARRRELYGRGFGLYASLPEIDVDRSRLDIRLAEGGFDLVVFSDIHRTFGRFVELLPRLARTRVAVLDGSDSPAMYPYAGRYWRRPECWSLPRAHRRFLYFKREWTEETLCYRYYRLLPKALARYAPVPRNLRPIAFSFPDEKIISPAAIPTKTGVFPRHIVDPEVRLRVAGASAAYAFDSEADYYADLACARFGITTRRSGWECLRHYEIAANGSVPCFRDLALKPHSCAPHGLDHGNSVSYRSADDLMAQIDAMSPAEYERKREGALTWARQNSTRARARQLLAAVGLPLAP